VTRQALELLEGWKSWRWEISEVLLYVHNMEMRKKQYVWVFFVLIAIAKILLYVGVKQHRGL